MPAGRDDDKGRLRKVEATHARRVAERLLLADGLLACSKCAKEICAVLENYKLHCAVIERPVKATNPYILNLKTYVDDKIIFRSYACPSCGLFLQIEMA
jgi:acetone carboxylase gamma subunit